jgi:hypothetical protein
MKATLLNTALTIALYTFPMTVTAGSLDLDWMLGCWTTEDGGSREVWVRQSDRQLIGFGVALNGGRVGFHEVLSIRSDDAGLHYTAHPAGQAATTFTTARSAGQEVSFTNERHDYPQRVAYRLVGQELHATISLLDGSNPTFFDKVRCK